MTSEDIYTSDIQGNVFVAILHLREAAMLLTDIDKNLSTTLLQVVKVLIEQSSISTTELSTINNSISSIPNE